MGHKPNDMKGVKPLERAIRYKIKLENGDELVASVIAYKVGANGVYQAWVQHPVYGCEMMTEKEGRLEGYTPVIAVCEDDVPAIIQQAVDASSLVTAGLMDSMLARLSSMEARIQQLEHTINAARVKATKPTGGAVNFSPPSGPPAKPVPPTPSPSDAEDLDFLAES